MTNLLNMEYIYWPTHFHQDTQSILSIFVSNLKIDLFSLQSATNNIILLFVAAQVLPRLITPTAQEQGYCDVVDVEEVGDTRVVVFRMESSESRISTVLIRGATDNYMDDVERAIDDGVNTFKGIVRDGR